MQDKITVNTQHGAGGPWVTDFEATIGPRNLMAAAKEKGSGQSGVGGYRTNLQIGDVVIDRFELQDLTLEKAKMICENPTHYAPADFCEDIFSARQLTSDDLAATDRNENNRFCVNGKNVSVTYEIDDRRDECNTESLGAIQVRAEIQVEGTDEPFTVLLQQQGEDELENYTLGSVSELSCDDVYEGLYTALGGDVEAVEEAGDRIGEALTKLPGMDAVFEVADEMVTAMVEEETKEQSQSMSMAM